MAHTTQRIPRLTRAIIAALGAATLATSLVACAHADGREHGTVT